MSFELIYTSAPRGIKADTRGYCTVAFTEGMPANYVQLAESLSGYQKPENIQIAPVAYSHYRFVVGGQRLSVLSRVTTAAYADYTGRCPTIAHHVLVEQASAQPDGNPARLMADPSMFVTEWHDEPHLIRKVKNLPSPPIASFAARQWETACGDAGWAGVLAQSALDAISKPVYIIVNPDRLDPLLLLAESLNLLPLDMRWTVTFNTFFTSLPHGTTCLWRCCLPDSPALREMRATPGTLCIDLTKPLGQAPSNAPLVESARTGAIPSWPQRGAMAFIPSPPAPTAPAAPTVLAKERTISAPSQPERVRVGPSAGIPRPAFGHIPLPPGKERKIWPIIVASASVAAVIMGIIGVVAFLLMRAKMFSAPPTLAVGTTNAPPITSLPPLVPIPVPLPEPTNVPPVPPKIDPFKPEPLSTNTPKGTNVPQTNGPVPPELAPEPIKPPTDMTPRWQSVISTFKQNKDEVSVNDPACSNHQHVFYFNDGRVSLASKSPSTIGPKDGTVKRYEISPKQLQINIAANKIFFHGTTNSMDYPVSMRIVRTNSGQGDLIIWLQTLTLENNTFTQTSSGYDISMSHPALTECLFGRWPTTNQPWSPNCRVHFKDSTKEELKDIPFSVKQDGDKSAKWRMSLTLNHTKLEEIQKSRGEEIKKTRALWKENNKNTNDYVRCVVNKYQSATNTDITNCLQTVAQTILKANRRLLPKSQYTNIQVLVKAFNYNYEKTIGSGTSNLENLKDKINQEIGKEKDNLVKLESKSNNQKDKQKNIEKTKKKIQEYEDFLDKIRKFENYIAEEKVCSDNEGCLKNDGAGAFFNMIFSHQDDAQLNFQEVAVSKEFQELLKQHLPNEPDPDNLRMIIEIYSRENNKEVLLSLSQQDQKDGFP